MKAQAALRTESAFAYRSALTPPAPRVTEDTVRFQADRVAAVPEQFLTGEAP